MLFKIEGIIDNMILYKKQRSTDPEYNYNIIEQNIKKYEQIILEHILLILKKLGYYIEKRSTRRMSVKNHCNEKIKLYYDLVKDKIHATYFLKFNIDIEFKDMSTELLLLFDYIYTYLENNTELYRKWEISYLGNTNNQYIIRDDIVKILTNSIIFCYKPRKDKIMNISELLKEIAVKELKEDDIYRSYTKKKIVLKELEENIETIYKIPINSKQRFKYKENEIIYTTSVIGYKEMLPKRYKVGIINAIIEEESIKISNKEIRNISIYKVANVSQTRKNKCYLYYVIEILYKHNVVNENNTISKNNTLHGNQKPYLRLYFKEAINKEELLEIVKYIKDNKDIEIKW